MYVMVSQQQLPVDILAALGQLLLSCLFELPFM
jgi:hypothetical protein